MPNQTVLDLVDHLANSTPRPGASSQAAFVRALVDEVDRHHPEDRAVVQVREQLVDELEGLAHFLEPLGGADPGAPREAAPVEPLDVLVVDDEEPALRATVAVLTELGYPSRIARDGEEALRELARKPAAIVLSDWCMPGMSGLELCTAVKQRDPRAYVILATAFHDNARLLDGVRGGVDDFLRKPLDVDELEARLISAGRLIRALRAADALQQRVKAAAAGAGGDESPRG